jgi:hypothetical protein
VEGRVKHAFALALVLLAVSPCFAAKDKGGIGPQTDFRDMPPEQVLALLKSPASIEITGAERHRDKLWFKMCERDGDECSSLASSDDLPLAIRLSIIGCSFEAVPGHQAMSNCPNLATYLLAVGNIDAARAVIEHAPGCHGFTAANDPHDQCFDALAWWPQLERLRESMPASEMAMLAKDAYSYAPSDVRAAEYLNGHGADIDIAAAEAAKHDATEANNAAVREHNAAIDHAEAVKDAHREALLNALQSNAPVGTIQDTADQQAAAVRAIGDANAAAQRQAAQQRLEAQQAAQQAVQQRAAEKQTQGTGANGNSGGSTGGNSQTAAVVTGGNGSSSANGGNSGSTARASDYAVPLPASCIGQFWDPKYYNWLSFQNNCEQAIHLSFIATSPNDTFGMSSTDIAPGQSSNTGWSKDEANRRGGFTVFVCPAGYVAVDALADQAVSRPNQNYRCKKW